MNTTATTKSYCPYNGFTKIALSISGDTTFPLIFLKDENSALHILNQLMNIEANEESISGIDIDGITHTWNQKIKVAVDTALTEWLSHFLDSDDIKSQGVDDSENTIARRQALFAEARKSVNDSVY